MSLATIFKRGRQPSDGAARTAERPASATASAEFWRAFLRQDPRPDAPYVAPENADAFVRSASSMGDMVGAGRDEGDMHCAPSMEPEAIARELGLSRLASVRALQRLRREFALKNHPDRVPSTLRARATRRMMIANAMIDAAMKRFQLVASRETGRRRFESGERI